MKREPSNEDAVKLQADAPEGVTKRFLSAKLCHKHFTKSIYTVYRGREVLEESDASRLVVSYCVV